jgi:RHS repeat-associated protein
MALLFLHLSGHCSNYGYTGQDADGGNGLMYLRARCYDPETGTFLEKDPLGVNAGLNMFVYVADNPVNRFDPSGLFTTGVGVSGSGFILGGYQASLVTTFSANNLKFWDWRLGTSFSYGLVGATTVGASGGFDIVYSRADSPEAWNGPSFGGGGSYAFVGSVGADVGNVSGDAMNRLFVDGQSLTSGDKQKLRYDANLGWGLNIPDFANFMAPLETHMSIGTTYGTSSSLADVGYTAITFTDSAFKALDSVLGSQSSGHSYGNGVIDQNAPVINIPSASPPVGGVLLNTAATLVGQNLSDITGAMYDPVSGQFVFLGTNNPTPVKNINLDYLTTALQAVYGSAVPPFVTLVPSAEITSSYTTTNALIYIYPAYPSYVSATLTSPFLDPYGYGYIFIIPGYYDIGDSPSVVINPNDTAYAAMSYNPIWPGEDTTVDVELRGFDYGPSANQSASFTWKARFNCVSNNLVFSQWVSDAHAANPPAGISIAYNYGWLQLHNGPDFIWVSSATAIPARQQRQFGGRVENTQVGWVMEEADRVMKCLCIGTDNLTGAPYNSGTTSPNLKGISGYKNLVELYAGSNPSGNVSTRQWFTPKLMTLNQYIDPKTGLASIVFSNATVLCQTENDLTGGTSPPQQQAFCDNLTANYDKFAALKFPCYDPTDPTGSRIIQTNIFGMLKDAMKAVSLARFFRDNNVPVDMWWLNSWQPPVAYAPKSVPTIVNYSANNTYTVSGGVQIQLPNAYIASATASNVAVLVQSSRPAVTGNTNGDIAQQVWTNTTSMGKLTAVAVNTAAEPQDGSVNLAETDLNFASPGEPLQFTRYYQSSWLGGDAMGPGWVYTPYVLQFSRPSWYDDYGWMTDNYGYLLPVLAGTSDTGLRSDNLRVVNMSSGATLDFVSSLVLGYAVDTNNRPYITLNGLTDADVPAFTPGLRQDGSILIQTPDQMEYQLFTPDGSVLVFDHNGKLLYTQDRNGWEQDYYYDSAGHLLSITDDAQQSFVFGYDAQTNYLMSVVGPNGEQVKYAYTNGCLATATHVRSGASVSSLLKPCSTD